MHNDCLAALLTGSGLRVKAQKEKQIFKKKFPLSAHLAMKQAILGVVGDVLRILDLDGASFLCNVIIAEFAAGLYNRGTGRGELNRPQAKWSGVSVTRSGI